MNENAVWKPHEDIVAAAVDLMRVEVRRLVAESQGDLTVDLQSVEMIDSRGLGLLIATANSLMPVGRRLRVLNANGDLRDLFKLMRLEQHFLMA